MTELVFALDRSGPMSGSERDTIGGFNSMIEKQKKEEGEAVCSVRACRQLSADWKKRIDEDVQKRGK